METAEKIDSNHIAIVLNRPKHPENIGSVARAMKNMGLMNLIVVAPEFYQIEKVLRLSTHAASDLVDRICIEKDLKEALSNFHYVVGTTARKGSQRQALSDPSEIAAKLIPVSKENRIAIVFGPEDRGLTNEELRLCHILANIPTADFSSINLAQSVMIFCYEIFKAGRSPRLSFSPRLASRHELDGMYDQLKEILVKIDYIRPENPDYWMNKMRFFFSRLPLRAGEVSIIRGICRQIMWYGKKSYQDGLKNRAENQRVPKKNDDQ